MGKIIFLDVDGTLVDYENHLPESAVLAVGRQEKTDTECISAQEEVKQKSMRISGKSDWME